MKKRILCIGSFLIASSILFSACSSQTETVESIQPLNATVINTPIVSEGLIVPEEDATLAFETGGTVSSIHVSKGDAVKAGDILIEIGDRTQLEAEQKAIAVELVNAQQALDDLYLNEALDRENAWQTLLGAQAAFDEAQEAYDDLDEDAYEDDLQDAEKDIIDAQQDVEDAQADLKEYLDLDEENSTRIRYENALEDAQNAYNEKVRAKSAIQIEHDRIVNSYQAAKAALNVAQTEYDKRKDGPDVDMLASLTAQIESLEASQTAVKKQLEKLELKAPFDGQVMEIYIDESEFASPGQPVIVIARTTQWIVETNDLTELEVVNIHEGQPVSIEAEAFPGETFSGTVDFISDFPEMDQGDVLYTVRIVINSQDLPALKWGMSVTISFEEE